MGVFSFETEISTVIPPGRVFTAFVLDSDSLIAKVLPNLIQSVEIIEGDGGPGTVKKMTFGAGDKISYMKKRIEAIDKENMIYNYSVIEGDLLTDKFEKIIYETKLVASSDGGSIFKSMGHYYTLGDARVDEDEIKAGNEKGLGIFKAIEAYLLANPHEYN